MEKVIDRFLARAQIEEGAAATSAARAALTLLQEHERERLPGPPEPHRLARLIAACGLRPRCIIPARNSAGRDEWPGWTRHTWRGGGWPRARAGRTHRLTEAGQGEYHYVYAPLCRARCSAWTRATRVEIETARRLRGGGQDRGGSALARAQHAVRQPAERADRRRGGGEGRRAGGGDPLDPAARPAAGRHDGAHPRVRRAGRHADHGDAERAARRAGRRRWW